MLSQAIALDGIACTVPFELSNAEYINALNDEFVKRFGAPLLGVHKSNVVLDPLEMDQTMKVSYCHVPLNVVDEFINNTVAETAVPVINIHTENISQISKNIVCRLSS